MFSLYLSLFFDVAFFILSSIFLESIVLMQNMTNMFSYSSFNKPINNWNVRSVNSFVAMFQYNIDFCFVLKLIFLSFKIENLIMFFTKCFFIITPRYSIN
jgi:hypothetical protein